MTDKEMKRLSRKELLEMLIVQTKKNEKLTAELDETKKELAKRQLVVQRTDNIEEATAIISNTLETAQKIVEKCLDNINDLAKDDI